ncbi:MAG: succinyl-diaminopimelate desuccinylase [Rhodospirillaceae bacterium]|nr:succinyl-diaminopimelate desuccinylase [Rhodospirillaceae bacterium]
MTVKVDPVDLAQRLIRCKSVTPSDDGALNLLQEVLEQIGFVCYRRTFEDTDSPPVDNLYARLGIHEPNFCFAGHTDVVPIGNPDQWTVDPFGGEIKNGKVYGRGATDMKSAIASFVAAVSEFTCERGNNFCGSLSLLITGDEEGPSINGTRKMLKWMKDSGEIINDCIVGEPTNPNNLGEMIKIGRRGSLSGWLTVFGTQGHAAYPHLANNPIPRILKIATLMMEEPIDNGTEHFQPTSLQITSIDVGNKATNVIPSEGRLTFNIRFNDKHTGKSLMDWVRRRCEKTCKNFDLKFQLSGEAFLTPPGKLSDLITAAVQKVMGKNPELSTTGGTSDARFIKDFCDVAEFGLVSQTMHKLDECAKIEDIHYLSEIYKNVLDGYFSPRP